MDTVEVPHVEVRGLVASVLTRFHHDKMIVANFKMVSFKGFAEEPLKEIEMEREVVVLKGPNVRSKDKETRD
jgi:hypothetical protein